MASTTYRLSASTSNNIPASELPSSVPLEMPSATPTDTLTQKSCASEQRDVPQARRHRDYYFEDGNVIIKVQDTLFKLHRSILERYSPVFSELFMVPQPQGSEEGLSDCNPIVLAGIEEINFTRLLWLLHPPVLGTCKVSTVDEWMSIFEQADRWQMDELREHALHQLRNLYIDPICKIGFWCRYNLHPNELIASYSDLILRSSALSLKEAEMIGLEMVVKIAQARDLAYTNGARSAYRGGYSVKVESLVGDIIKRVFGLPLPPSPTSML